MSKRLYQIESKILLSPIVNKLKFNCTTIFKPGLMTISDKLLRTIYSGVNFKNSQLKLILFIL